MNKFKIIEGKEELFENIWKNRETHLENVSGFKKFHLIKGIKKDNFTIYASHSSGIQSQKVLIMDNGSTAYSNEFAVMFSSSLLISFSADLVGAAVRIRGTPESGISGNISIKFIKTIIE